VIAIIDDRHRGVWDLSNRGPPEVTDLERGRVSAPNPATQKAELSRPLLSHPLALERLLRVGIEATPRTWLVFEEESRHKSRHKNLAMPEKV